MTNSWRVVELTADPLKPTQPMDASGMKALTPTGTASPHSLPCILCYLICEITKLPPSLLRTCSSVQPFREVGQEAPQERRFAAQQHTHQGTGKMLFPLPMGCEPTPSLYTVTSISRSHGISEMSVPVIMPTLLYASVEGAARELWDTGGGG